MMTKLKILVIDDNESILDSTKIILEEFGYSCFILSRVDNLFPFMRKVRPDLILLDILLSGADGRDVCLEIKNREEFSNIPIILFSAHTIVKDNYMDFKANDFIEKPFEINDLIAAIGKQLEKPVII